MSTTKNTTADRLAKAQKQIKKLEIQKQIDDLRKQVKSMK